MTKYYAPKDIAEYCGVNVSAVYSWKHRGYLPQPEKYTYHKNGLPSPMWSEPTIIKLKEERDKSRKKALQFGRIGNTPKEVKPPVVKKEPVVKERQRALSGIGNSKNWRVLITYLNDADQIKVALRWLDSLDNLPALVEPFNVLIGMNIERGE